MHGGRFIGGSLNSHDSLCRALAAKSGCTVVAVDYRLAPEHRFPAAIEDCHAVANALTDPLVICGDSAGGNLAAAVTLQARARFLAQVLIYPMLDASCSLESHVSCASGYGPGSDDMKRGWREYAPTTGLRTPLLSPLWEKNLSDLPPALILSAEYDSLRDEAEEFVRRLTNAGVEVTLTRYEGAIHGFFQMAGVLSLGRIALEYVASYIRKGISMSDFPKGSAL
jgi:acetyl esterase